LHTIFRVISAKRFVSHEKRATEASTKIKMQAKQRFCLQKEQAQD